MELTVFQRRILDEIQAGFPLAADPFTDLGSRLGAGADAVAHAVGELRQSGVVRRIGGSFAAAALGLRSTLAAAIVRSQELETVAARVSQWPEVTHNYERTDVFNLWFTLSGHDRHRLETLLDTIRRLEGVEALIELPVARLFKLRAVFRFGNGTGGGCRAEAAASKPESAGAPFVPDDLDRRLIAIASRDIGPGRYPFRAPARDLEIGEDAVLSRLARYRDDGVMRRFGAILRHRQAGIRANGMCVWDLPSAAVRPLAERLCALDEVTHCYERQRAPGWAGNLYAMIHAATKDKVRERAAAIAAGADVPPPRILFSTREFKKTSLDLDAVWRPAAASACLSAAPRPSV